MLQGLLQGTEMQLLLGSQFQTGISQAFLSGVLYSAYKSPRYNDSFKNLLQ